jgi:histidinol dehydrogenase
MVVTARQTAASAERSRIGILVDQPQSPDFVVAVAQQEHGGVSTLIVVTSHQPIAIP